MEDEKERTMTFSQLLLLVTVLPEDVMLEITWEDGDGERT